MASTVERVIRLQARHYDIAGKDRVSDIGQAVDAARKEEVVPLGAVPSHRFDPHDYLLEGYYHEIKSSAGTWLSIPNSEVEFAESEIDAGRDVIYDIVLQLDLQNARFLGQVAFSEFRHLIEPSKFLTWRRVGEDSWVQERSHRVLLSKVKPLLT
jgi:hypothetical protein